MVPAGIIVADKGHDSLAEPHGNLQGHHIDFLGNAHGRHFLGPIGRCKIVQDCHARNIQQVLDRSRYSHAAHAQHDCLLHGKLPGQYADKGGLPSDV